MDGGYPPGGAVEFSFREADIVKNYVQGLERVGIPQCNRGADDAGREGDHILVDLIGGDFLRYVRDFPVSAVPESTNCNDISGIQDCHQIEDFLTRQEHILEQTIRPRQAR
jgi:hypothetical protein